MNSFRLNVRAGWRLWACACVLFLSACQTPPKGSPTVPPSSEPSAPAMTTPTPQAPVLRTPTLGLALGGGAARGFAHIGVIQILEEEGIRPDVVTGTSAGSFVAALYTQGKSGAQLQQLALSMEEAVFTDWTIPFTGRGLLRGDALARYLVQQLGPRTLESSRPPLGITATRLQNGEAVLFQTGDLATAVRASSAVPGVFEPVRIRGLDHVDGGLVSPVPVESAKAMGAEVVLAVDISSRPEDMDESNILKVLLKTTTIMGQRIGQFELQQATVVVKPELRGISSIDFADRTRAIQAGRVAMRAALPALRLALQPRVVKP
jgi:NTE family protein